MKSLNIIIVILFAIIAAFVYEHKKTVDFESFLETVAKDRKAMSLQLKNLEQRITAEKSREPVSAPTRASDVPPPLAAAPAVPARVEPVATPGVSITAPTGWSKNGSNTGAYVVGVDQQQSWGGMPSGYVKSNGASANDFGGMMQMASAENFIGQRLRLSGWVKTEDANDGGGHLWMRVDGQQVGTTLQFDNMDNRAVMGTKDWQECSVVLDVPANAQALAYGFFLKGGGKMWVNGTKFEPVGAEVPSTNRVTAPTGGATRRTLPKTPVNLSFAPDPPK